MYCERRVQRLEEKSQDHPIPEVEPLAAYQELPAWVLLGEPGSGKTEALKHEADVMGESALYLTLADFLVVDHHPEAWHGKTLFLDGLDEIRGGTDLLVMQKIANRLQCLGDPPFRLSCRAADWRGSSDLHHLKVRAPNKAIEQLALCPLDRDDLKQLLRRRYEYSSARVELFLQKAEQHNIHSLLGNPISLHLLVQALKQQSNEEWPDSRTELLKLACQQLLSEENRTHRDRQRGQRPAPDTLLNSAGELCALLLLADKQGVAIDQDVENELYPALEELNLSNPVIMSRALNTRVFVTVGEERLGPVHRTLAEYLGAHWINARLASRELTPQRLLNLLLAPDGGLVSGLRGIAAWIAVLNSDMRRTLIKADPLGLVQYGDVRSLAKENRQELLQQFVQRASELPQFHWQLDQSKSTGELAMPDMHESFQRELQQYRYTEPSQAGLSAVLTILAHDYYPLTTLKDNLLTIVRDARCWELNRIRALESWLNNCTPHEALRLLQAVAEEKIQDADDEILGHLLDYAYPSYLPTDNLLKFLRPPHQPTLLGAYWKFWRIDIFERLPEADIPVLLDQLVTRPDLFEGEVQISESRQLADRILIRALESHGNEVNDNRLFDWLGVGTDQYGLIRRDPEIQQRICDWLSNRPERLKAMIGMAIESDCADSRRKWQRYHQQRLHDAQHPDDMASWLLSQIERAPNAIASAYADYLVQWGNTRYNPINITLDQVLRWQQDHPERAELLKPLLVCELPSWQIENAHYEVRQYNRQQEHRRERTEAILPLLSEIRIGTAAFHIYDTLAKLWHGLFIDVKGNTPLERFEQYCEVGEALYEATSAGFIACVTRIDLPTAHEIIRLRKEERRHLLGQAAQTGAQLLWKSDEEQFKALSEQRLASLIAFHETGASDQDNNWWPWCLQCKPELTASVLVDYANTLLQAGQVHLTGIDALAYDDNYEEVARLALPLLLKGFPLRALRQQLRHLQNYIRAAQRLTPRALEEIATEKLSRKSLLTNQRPFWLVALMMTNPESYEDDLIKELAHSRQRLKSTAGALEELASQDNLNRFSAHLTGQLIERLMGIQNLKLVSGLVKLEHRLGDLTRQLISRLSSDPDPACTQAIERLLNLPLPDNLRFRLLDARENQLLVRREHEYQFLDIQQVSQILRNQQPQSAKDLQNLALDVLTQVACDLKSSNADTFKLFWDKASQTDRTPKWENDCRDALLTLIRDKLTPFEVNASPEADHRGDKRSDIQLRYRNKLSLPIEIKLEHSKDLWDAIREQLVKRYTITPESGGRGLFVVFWFGEKPTRPPPGGGSKPKTAKELEQMLQKQLSRAEVDLIRVVVIDVTE